MLGFRQLTCLASCIQFVANTTNMNLFQQDKLWVNMLFLNFYYKGAVTLEDDFLKVQIKIRP